MGEKKIKLTLFKKYLLYLFRWQLSTIILAPCVFYLSSSLSTTGATILANLIGGLIFFWIDQWIFSRNAVAVWYIKDNHICDACGDTNCRTYRLVSAKKYDKRNSTPVWLCEKCSAKKSELQRANGIIS